MRLLLYSQSFQEGLAPYSLTLTKSFHNPYFVNSFRALSERSTPYFHSVPFRASIPYFHAVPFRAIIGVGHPLPSTSSKPFSTFILI